MYKSRLIHLLLVTLSLFVVSCNKDGEILSESLPPVIELDSEDGYYLVKIGKEFSISPVYRNVDNTTEYQWTCDGTLISDKPALSYTFNEPGTYYVTISVNSSGGRASEEIRIDADELAPPVISIAVPAGGLKVLAGHEYEITPDVINADGATYSWTLDGKPVGDDLSYRFLSSTPGRYSLSFTATNADGSAEKSFDVEVVDRMPVSIVIPTPMYFTTSADVPRYVAEGGTIYLRPYLSVTDGVTCSWSIDGEAVAGADDLLFAFTPAGIGEYKVTFTAGYSDPSARERYSRNISSTGVAEASVDIVVKCCKPAGVRPYVAGNSLTATKVYEYIPAPGQFINEKAVSDFNGESTHEAACGYAKDRLDRELSVSLGAWGGFITVGFDHSIPNRGGYDFSIKGNPIDTSSEPGIVWVMQDVNGNGIPDDEWYQLKGSEYGKPETIEYYSLTYFRPGPEMNTRWIDSEGATGVVRRIPSQHPQPYYYPLWIKEDSYTLYGVRLAARTVQSSVTGMWSNEPFPWGYADNFGDDLKVKDNPEAGALANYFRISDAVNPDGSPAALTHIDFIKVQTGVNADAGQLGENSTEVFGFKDETSY